MLKSRVFSFNEINLIEDIERFRATGREVSELQCNRATSYIWTGIYLDDLIYPIEFHSEDDRTKGIIGRYQGIPVVINEALDDGTIGIK